MSPKTPVMLVLAKWYLLPFFVIAAFAYHCWYLWLIDRGFGYLYNAMMRHDTLVAAQISFGVVGIGGIALFELFRRRMSIWIRLGYQVAIASMIALFAVDLIVDIFGPTPYWHH